MRSAASLRVATAAYRRGYGNKAGNGTGNGPKYRQGQSPAPRRREYFYWVDAHGRLYLDDAKVKNFITCFKDERFLAFFFHRLQPNRSGRYEDSFPFVSPCGAERNFVRCQDLPVVFTRVLEGENGGGSLLSYCGGGSRLALPFQPESLTFDPENGRLYHPGPEGGGGVGLVKSALVEEWGDGFEYGGKGGGGGKGVPTHFVWGGKRYALGHPLLGRLRALRGGGRGEGRWGGGESGRVVPKPHGRGRRGTAGVPFILGSMGWGYGRPLGVPKPHGMGWEGQPGVPFILGSMGRGWERPLGVPKTCGMGTRGTAGGPLHA